MRTSQFLHDLLTKWPYALIQDRDLAALMPGRDQSRYDMVKLALKQGKLLRLKRGIYLIQPPYQQGYYEPFVIAQTLYGPSYISFHSALSHHNLIPEAVYATTSATTRRSVDIETPIGPYSYSHVPKKEFLLGVERRESDRQAYFIATPWRALADYHYQYRRGWEALSDICEDLRVEREDLETCDLPLLSRLSETYPSCRVRRLLQRIYGELKS